jgi:lambda repressor-like predicted transcriptional regulator
MEYLDAQTVTDIRTAIRVAGVSLRVLAQRAGLPYERCQRLLRRERKARPGELQAVVGALNPAEVHGRPRRPQPRCQSLHGDER